MKINCIDISTCLTDFSREQLQILYNAVADYEYSISKKALFQDQMEDIATVKTQILNAIGLVEMRDNSLMN